MRGHWHSLIFSRLWFQNMILSPLSYWVFRQTGQASKSITPINSCARFTFVCLCTMDIATRQHVGVEAVYCYYSKGQEKRQEGRRGKYGGGRNSSAENGCRCIRYTRIGTREYGPFEHQEITIANVKDACKKHFKPQIEKDPYLWPYWLESAGHLAKRWPMLQTEKCSIYAL